LTLLEIIVSQGILFVAIAHCIVHWVGWLVGG
jgi:hypothetical protein